MYMYYMCGGRQLISSDCDSDRRTAFLSKTQVNVVCKFLDCHDDFDIKNKIVSLMHLLGLSSMLTASPSPDITVVKLEVSLFLSTSLMAAIKGFEKLIATAFWLAIIIIHMMNTIACVAVSEMFEFYGDIQGRSHFLPTTIKCN